MKSEIVLEVLAEGGSITLFGNVEDTQQYWVETDESGFCEDDPEFQGMSEARKADLAFSFEAALEKLDRYPWWELSPAHIHPGYRGVVLEAVRNRIGSMAEEQSAGLLERWLTVAGRATEPTDLRSLLQGFRSLEWSVCYDAAHACSGHHVYAIVVTADHHSFPLYVGQTGRLSGRIGDYMAAEFQASTDFRVGEAIKYLTQKSCHIDFYYRPSDSDLLDEKNLIREFLLAGYCLLNFLPSYDYSSADRKNELSFVHRFCDTALLRSKDEWPDRRTLEPGSCACG